MKRPLTLTFNLPRLRRHSSFNNIANEHYAEFLTGRRATLSKRKAYMNEADHVDRPITFYYAQEMRHLQLLVGEEQTSTHYESFWISRRYALTCTFLGIAGMILQKVTDLNWVIRTWTAGIPFYMMGAIWFYEGAKYVYLPRHNTFYMMIANNEMKMMQNAFPEKMQAIVDRNMKDALGQFDFLILHKKFNAVKQESLRAFMANQELELRQGVRERAADLLRLAEEMESSNRKQLLGKVVSALQAEVQAMLVSPPQEVVDAAFEAALVGIKEGRMEYKGDKSVEFILRRIREESGKYSSMGEEQQRQLVELTEEQMKMLKDTDVGLRQAYLKKGPASLDNGVLNLDSVKPKVANW